MSLFLAELTDLRMLDPRRIDLQIHAALAVMRTEAGQNGQCHVWHSPDR